MPKLISTQEALYRTMHNCHPRYKGFNQGIRRMRHWLDQLKEPPASILEVGCGNGELCKVLTTMGYDVTGLDIVPGPYDRRAYKFVKHDIQLGFLPFEDNEFDYCLSFDVLEHLPRKWTGQLLHCMLRCSTRGIIGTAACFCVHPNYGLHLTVENPDWWKELISRTSEKEMEYRIVYSQAGETLLFNTKKENENERRIQR